MSRRDDRDRERDRDRDRNYDSRRHRSRFDREPRHKRSDERDRKPGTERVPSNIDTDREQKHHHRLQDASPVEAPSAPVLKVDTVEVNKESDNKHESKANGRPHATKHSSAPTEVPQSRSYFQHDERGNAGRNSGRRTTTDRSWTESKDMHNERPSKKAAYDSQQKEEKTKSKGDESSVWRHDGFFEMESDPTLPPPPPLPPPPARKRPAFREKKIPGESEISEKTTMDLSKPRFPDRPAHESERREERGRDYRNFRRPEKPFAGDRGLYRGEARRNGFSSRERYGGGGGGGTYNGRDRLGSQGYRSSDTVAEKWKHDLYDEANKSPPPKNEEDQIAKVEALLAS